MSVAIRRILLMCMLLSLALQGCALPGAAGQKTTPGALGNAVETVAASTVQAALTREAGSVPAEATPAPDATSTPAPAGEEKPAATQTPAAQEPPMFIPFDNLRVAFIDTTRNLSVWSDDKGVIQVTNTNDVVALRVSPDGEQIAYVRAAPDQTNANLWVINRDGSAARPVFNQQQMAKMAPVTGALGIYPAQFEWIPGQNQLAVSTRGVMAGPGQIYSNNVVLVDLARKIVDGLLPPGKGGMFAFSPDGKKIAVTRPDGLDIANSDGKNRATLMVFPPINTASEYQYYPVPVWAVDSQSLTVAIPPEAPLNDASAMTMLWRVPADGRPPTRLTSVLTAPLVWPLIAPGGKMVAYLSSGKEPNGPMNVNVTGVDDGVIQNITNNGGSLAAWSADGKMLVFFEHKASAPLITAPGGKAAQLSSAVNVKAVVFSASGHAVILSQADKKWEIRIGTPGLESDVIASFPLNDVMPQIDTMR